MPYKDKNKQRAYQASWIKNRRKEFFADKSCKKCGETDRLELHHRDPNKKVAHSIWSWSGVRRKKEIEKCDVLCRRCHQKLHHPRTTTHGTLTMYKKYKCRCEKCRLRNAQYEKERRGRTKSPIMVSRYCLSDDTDGSNEASMPPTPLGE